MSTTLRLAARNATRRRSRTLLTAGMVVFGVAMLLVAMSWIRGVADQMRERSAAVGGHVRVVTKGYAAREDLAPLYENIADVEALGAVLRRQSGVVAVEPRITTGVTVTVGEEIGDVFAQVVGASEVYFRERMGAKDELVAGHWFTGAADEVIAGEKVVEQTGAKPGDELVLLGMTQDGTLSPIKAKLVGVVSAGDGGLGQQLLIPLPRVQYLADLEGGATELLVYAADHEDAPALARQLKALPALEGYDVQAWEDREPWKTLSASIRGMEAVVVLVFVVLAALGIWNTMMMSVLERTHEIGVLRAMGLSRRGTVGLFVGEALAIAIGGGLLGVALGAYPSWLLETKGVYIGSEGVAAGFSQTMRGDLSWSSVLLVFGLGLLMALLGSLIPAIRAANIQPVSAMRSGR
ncbi:MAG: ABC transporter permease [Myxococcaceae bacterium]|nr:ABC transporter permease [Myxococcaceae bacterium]